MTQIVHCSGNIYAQLDSDNPLADAHQTHGMGNTGSSAMKRLAAVGVLFPVKVLVGFQARIVGVAELASLFVGDGVA
jgi:hypothetical protein